MNDLNLIKALSEKPMRFSLKEIQEIMDKELNKPPEDMNTELIDLCADCIEKRLQKRSAKQPKRIKFNKFIAAAAVIAILSGIAMPITADYIKSGVKGRIITQYEDSYEINLNKAADYAKTHSSSEFSVIKELENIGLDGIILPQAMLKKSDCSFSEFMHSKEENHVNARVNFNYGGGITGVIYIFRGYTDEKTYDLAISEATGTAENIKIINNNGMEILIESKKQKSYILYKDNNTVYHIHLESCSFDDAVSIAGSLE